VEAEETGGLTIYLARKLRCDRETTYLVRHSYQDGEGRWLTGDLFDLGPDPEQYILYVGARGYYFDPAVEQAIADQGVAFEDDELEEIFRPFLDPQIRRAVEQFVHRGRRGQGQEPRKSEEELAAIQKGIHLFDRRRLCFLKFAQIDMEGLVARPLPFFNTLLNKSRDEIENLLYFMELGLRPWHMRGYLYAVFDIPRRLPHRLSRFIPDVQDQDLIDAYFLEEICMLNRDRDYLDQGAVPRHAAGLHPYLRRYLFQYFDMAYKHRSLGGATRGSRSGRGAWSPPARSSDQGHLAAFGIKADEFKNMGARELTRIFRRKAKRLHPDRGGDHEAFIRLRHAYTALIRRKKW
jgi:hypothetical protein